MTKPATSPPSPIRWGRRRPIPTTSGDTSPPSPTPWPAPSEVEPADPDARGERTYAGTLIRRAGEVRYEHDAQGRVTLRQQKRLSERPRTWRYTWDGDDRLVAVTTPEGGRWRYRYDPLGRRIAKERLGDDDAVVERVDFSWDGAVLAEQTQSGGEGGSDRTTVWEWKPGSFRPVIQAERAPLRDASQDWIDKQFFAIVTDYVGTPTEMVDAEGNLAWRPRTTLWGAFVDQEPGGASCPLRFPGQYHDPETGLNYNYYRYYDPANARYESNDPIGLGPGPNPQAYVLNPTNWVDPLGLMSCPPRFVGTEKPWTRGATPNSIYTHVDPVTGLAKQNAIYDKSGNVIGHVDFKQHGASPPGHGHMFPEPGNPASGHGPGKPHIPPEQLPPGWGDLPPGIKPAG